MMGRVTQSFKNFGVKFRELSSYLMQLIRRIPNCCIRSLDSESRLWLQPKSVPLIPGSALTSLRAAGSVCDWPLERMSQVLLLSKTQMITHTFTLSSTFIPNSAIDFNGTTFNVRTVSQTGLIGVFL